MPDISVITPGGIRVLTILHLAFDYVFLRDVLMSLRASKVEANRKGTSGITII